MFAGGLVEFFRLWPFVSLPKSDRGMELDVTYRKLESRPSLSSKVRPKTVQMSPLGPYIPSDYLFTLNRPEKIMEINNKAEIGLVYLFGNTIF